MPHSNLLEQVEDALVVILDGHGIFGKPEFWSCSITPIWTLTTLSSIPSPNPVRQKGHSGASIKLRIQTPRIPSDLCATARQTAQARQAEDICQHGMRWCYREQPK